MAKLLWNPYANYQSYRTDPNQMGDPFASGQDIAPGSSFQTNASNSAYGVGYNPYVNNMFSGIQNSQPVSSGVPVAPLTGYNIPPISQTMGSLNPPSLSTSGGLQTTPSVPVAPLTGYNVQSVPQRMQALRIPSIVSQSGTQAYPSSPVAPPIGDIIPNVPPMSQTIGNLQPPSIGAPPAPVGNLVSPDSLRGKVAQTRKDMRDAYGNFTDNQKLTFGTEAVVGGVNLAVDAGSIASQRLNLGKPSTMFYEEGVNPVYRTGEYFNKAYYAKPMGATGAEVANTGLKAAATGSKLGGMLGGPAGAAVGAAAGAVVGAGTALLAGGVRKRRQEREKQRALNLARGQQADYNRRSLDFSQQQTAMNEYRRRNDPYERMSNFYTA